MDVVYKILVVLHFLGLASLIGGWLVQLRAVGERYVSAAMLHGVLTQLVTGVLLVGLGRGVDLWTARRPNEDRRQAGGHSRNHDVVLGNRRRQYIPNGLYFLIGLLAVANVVVAVFWR